MAETSEELIRNAECDTEKLNAALKAISYGVPQGLSRVPWIETLALTSTQEPISEKGLKPDDRVEIEKAMYSQVQESVVEAFRRFAAMGIEANRPDDFYAEMLKTDQQMGKIRENLADQQKRIEIVEDRKRKQAEKKFGKKMQVAAAQARAAQKRENLAEIEKWKEAKGEDESASVGKTLEKVSKKGAQRSAEMEGASHGKGGKGGKAGKGGKGGKGRVNKKRVAKDKKYGQGGPKRVLKNNSADSCRDVSSFKASKHSPMGKGKGKGKGKGVRKPIKKGAAAAAAGKR